MGLLNRLFRPKLPPVHVDDGNFKDVVLQADTPVILDIWSPGCAPCRQLEPVMMDLKARYEGRILVAEMNSRGAPQAAMKLRISATPTVIYFNGGREKDRVMGFRSSLYHEEAIEELFGIARKA